MKALNFGFALALLGLTTLGCGDDKDDGKKESAALEIIGEYEDDFGGDQIITADDWNGSAVIEYDNAKNVVYTQFPEDDMFSPEKFAKTVYTQPKDDSFYFCMIEFSLDTLADAKASKKTADEDDLEGEGCSGFPWSKATNKK